ncbi:MAG: 2-isopropylmalate synthase [Omnitrophica WOR_2 bacterium RIFCSPLOWO2_12_FULL_51_24]|nr:MAG: 2-isopropylmalate synthase [Omnitrophica WOR_2 bacterium RIFCSPHIGHO2_01_FULL_49_10]OGX34438.1 MAG: 2-isopropylmalate synthase [Omnitrophica WOR_2 bacterium RIFCSPLOWO2_02_FULL_50_19]OGX42166.1 MAG: 2-isopropylmalate synthase [Omnitrophica WOR_2 bacterium RIFCSPLOWO2_12_FULL_51_24]
MEKIIIFDTTLRDGEQSPGASLESHEKLEIAGQLVRLNVDVIEAGFPVSSPGDFAAVKSIAQRVKGPVICGLARCMKKDIEAAGEAIKPAKRKRIHIFLATSKIHMKYKLRKAEDEIVKLAIEGVKYARNFTDDVEFSPEDASRSEKKFLYRVIEQVIIAGATTINIPDTVGYAIPEEYGALIRDIKRNVPNIGRAVISVHCHNDLGLGVANSLAAIKNGARQIECTINGIGERAGNASLEEIVMAIKTRNDFFENFSTGIVTEEISKTSRLVSKLTGIMVQPNKAIVGQNAFAHEAGIHQDGVLKRRTTYEIMSPEEIGLSASSLVLGKHSGRHAFVEKMKKLGYALNESGTEKAFGRFKALADKKKFIYDEDLETLMDEGAGGFSETWKLLSFRTVAGTDETPIAAVKLRSKAGIKTAEAEGDGPVDACCKAIDKITRTKGEMMDYSIQAVTKGKDALGEVTVRVRSKDKEAIGKSASTDVIEASARAYLNAINKLIHKGNKRLRIEI